MLKGLLLNLQETLYYDSKPYTDTNPITMSNPRIFTKPTVFIFSVLGSTFFGALVYCSNLQALNKKQLIAPTIAFSIIWSIVLTWILKGLGYPMVKYFLINGIGGLILIKPLWNYHFPNLPNYENRKVWGPSLTLAIPFLILFSLHWMNRPDKKSFDEQQSNFTSLMDSASMNSTFVLNDSIVNFKGLSITLPSYSYYYTVDSDMLKMLYSTIYFNGGSFSIQCLVVPLSKDETLDLSIIKKNTDSIYLTDMKYPFAKNAFTGYYETYKSDTLSAGGQFVLFKQGNEGYLLTSDYPMLNSDFGDSISDYVFNTTYFSL